MRTKLKHGRWFILLMSTFVAMMASINGLATLVNPTGTSIGMTPQMLQIGPFHSYLVPAIVLLIMIVGGNVAIIVNLLRVTEQFSYVLMIVGIFQTTFILVQLMMFGLLNWLHIVYLLYGSWQIIVGMHYFGQYYAK